MELWLPTEQNLGELHDRLNQKYFNSELKQIVITTQLMPENQRTWMGYFQPCSWDKWRSKIVLADPRSLVRSRNYCVPHTPQFNETRKLFFAQTLIHEMIHQRWHEICSLSSDIHGPEFHEEAIRIANLAGVPEPAMQETPHWPMNSNIWTEGRAIPI